MLKLREFCAVLPSSLSFECVTAPDAKAIHEAAADQGRVARHMALTRDG